MSLWHRSVVPSAWLTLWLTACTGPSLWLGDYGPGAARPPEPDSGVPESLADGGRPTAADGGDAAQPPSPDVDDAGEPEDAADKEVDEKLGCTEQLHCQQQVDQPLCDTRLNRCVECLTDPDCDDPQESACLDGRCVQCRSDVDCAAPATCQEGECEG